MERWRSCQLWCACYHVIRVMSDAGFATDGVEAPHTMSHENILDGAISARWTRDDQTYKGSDSSVDFCSCKTDTRAQNSSRHFRLAFPAVEAMFFVLWLFAIAATLSSFAAADPACQNTLAIYNPNVRSMCNNGSKTPNL